MATGIVSVAVAERGVAWLSWTLLAVALAISAALAPRAARHRVVGDESFAIVAATSVLGARWAIAGRRTVALAFFAGAVALWAAVWLGRPRPAESTGVRLLAAVATESLAVVATLATAGLAPVGLVFCLLGVALYVQRAARLDPGELRRSVGEVWVTMGALAISALAAADLADRLPGQRWLQPASLGLWSAASCWLPVLAAAEARWPRLRFRPARWGTVFPLGMYATATAAVARAAGVPALREVSHVFLWIALAAWLATAAGACRRGLGSTVGARLRR